MPEFFKKIEQIDYPKKRIDLYIYNMVGACCWYIAFHSFARAFIYIAPFVLLSFHSIVLLLVCFSFLRSFVCSLIRLLIRMFVRSLFPSFMHSFIYAFIQINNLFIHSWICSFVLTVIRLFILVRAFIYFMYSIPSIHSARVKTIINICIFFMLSQAQYHEGHIADWLKGGIKGLYKTVTNIGPSETDEKEFVARNKVMWVKISLTVLDVFGVNTEYPAIWK